MSIQVHEDVAVAESLATQVREAEANGQRRTWRKMSTLVSMFGGKRLTGGLRARMAQSLHAAGLDTEPSLLEPSLTRADSVRLLTRNRTFATAPHVEEFDVADASQVPTDTSVVSYTRWIAGESPQQTGSIDPRRNGAMFLQVNPNMEPADALLRAMRPHCEGLELETVENLLIADGHPDLEAQGVHILRVSTIAVMTLDPPEEGEHPAKPESVAGDLHLAPVEYVIGPDWLVVCWHNFVDVNSGETKTGIEKVRKEVLDNVEHTWLQEDCGESSGDLATLITIELAARYSPALRQMESWLDQWEHSAGQASETTRLEVQSLVDLQLLLSEFARRLGWFREVKIAAAETWFPQTTHTELQAHLSSQIDRCLARLEYLKGSVRSCMDLANMHNLRYQLGRADERQHADDLARRKADDFQRNLSYLAAVFLAPSLVAAIYGANTALPGLHSWLGFSLMIALMLIAGVAALGSIRYFRSRQETRRVSVFRGDGPPIDGSPTLTG